MPPRLAKNRMCEIVRLRLSSASFVTTRMWVKAFLMERFAGAVCRGMLTHKRQKRLGPFGPHGVRGAGEAQAGELVEGWYKSQREVARHVRPPGRRERCL